MIRIRTACMQAKALLLLALALSTGTIAVAQSRALPFLEISPDVRTSAMGGSSIGEARTMYQYTNPTSALLSSTKLDVALSTRKYTLPELSSLAHLNATASYRLGSRHAFMLGYRYYRGLATTKEDEQGARKAIKPMDYAVDLSYAYRFDEHWSAYLTGHFIQSYVGKVAYTAGASWGLYYRNSGELLGTTQRFALGLTGDNIGAKVQYGKAGHTSSMPASIALGGSTSMELNPSWALSLGMTHRYFAKANDSKHYLLSLGAEAVWRDALSLRLGTSLGQGNDAFTFGAGYRFNSLSIDAAYLIQPQTNYNAFSLGLSFGFK